MAGRTTPDIFTPIPNATHLPGRSTSDCQPARRDESIRRRRQGQGTGLLVPPSSLDTGTVPWILLVMGSKACYDARMRFRWSLRTGFVSCVLPTRPESPSAVRMI